MSGPIEPVITGTIHAPGFLYNIVRDGPKPDTIDYYASEETWTPNAARAKWTGLIGTARSRYTRAEKHPKNKGKNVRLVKVPMTLLVLDDVEDAKRREAARIRKDMAQIQRNVDHYSTQLARLHEVSKRNQEAIRNDLLSRLDELQDEMKEKQSKLSEIS